MIDGFVVVDKPAGWTSHDVVARCRKIFGQKRVGHAGTLDPDATGVLLVGLGRATRLLKFVGDLEKAYVGDVVLGATTTTLDAAGEVTATFEMADVSLEAVRAAAAKFVGEIEQIPPMHSALKRDGKALYEYARAGIEIERQPRRIAIREIAVMGGLHDEWTIDVRCSKGTYIRTLAEDIGEALGCGAHLSALRRTASGNFEASQCVTLEALEAMSEEERLAQLLPVESLVASHTSVMLPPEDAARFLSGLRRRGGWVDAAEVAVFGSTPRAFLGTAHVKAGELIPGRLLNPIEIQQTLLTEATP